MKTIVLGIIFSVIMTAIVLAAVPETPEITASHIRTTTSAQMYRYGRELFRKGDYKEAAKVFKRILGMDCRNKLAQYHLQKIAAQGKNFQDIAKFLEQLSCPDDAPSSDDFLPSALFYEKDTDLLLEQLALYNKRFLKTRSELANKIDQYKDMISQLEQRTATLKASLHSAKEDAENAALWKERLKESTILADRFRKDAAQLKIQLDAMRSTYSNDYETLQEQIKAAITTTQKQAMQQKFLTKESELTAQWNELTTLQEKFDSIQESLRQVQASIASQNIQMKLLNNSLSTVEK